MVPWDTLGGRLFVGDVIFVEHEKRIHGEGNEMKIRLIGTELLFLIVPRAYAIIV